MIKSPPCTIAELLKRKGYFTEFIYGGDSDFDNMGAFFYGNGFEKVVDEAAFSHPVFHSTWGVSDEDLVRRANEEFVAKGDKPFFALMLSTSNHAPFDYPAGRIEPYEQPANTAPNAIKYADYAIGEFFRLAKKEADYKNTIFLVVADHNTRVYGADLLPINKFHIPGLIIGPGVKAGRFDKLASQVDLLPTLLDFMGVESDHPMVGHDLLAMKPDEPGRAIMQYGQTNAYEVGEHVVISQPYKPQLEFRYEDGKLIPEPLNPELARDALAHILFPYLLYREQSYRLPPLS
jgi:phosphoglycerol transferase MdoB-like AlkP superfamily enzyme